MCVRKENDIDRVPAVVESGKDEKALNEEVKDIYKAQEHSNYIVSDSFAVRSTYGCMCKIVGPTSRSKSTGKMIN